MPTFQRFDQAQRLFAEAYREEARKLQSLPAAAPAPRLEWIHDDADWVVLGIEHVAARAPRRPWRTADLDRCLVMAEEMARTLTPAPDGLEVEDIGTELATWPAYWEQVPAAHPDVPGLRQHAAEAAALARGFAEVSGGTTLIHTDIRDDNLLLAADGRTLLCDWNWPVRGAVWLDTLFLLIGPRGDGLDVDAVLAESPLLRGVEPEAVDAVLALVTGYFLVSAGQPVPPTSPHIRDAQRWQGLVCWHWLAERRGWDLGDTALADWAPDWDLGG